MNIISNRSWIAGGNITVGRFVTATSGSPGTVTQSASAATFPVGFSSMQQDAPPGVAGTTPGLAAVQGEYLQVLGPGEEGWIELGATLTANALVSADANGKAVARSTTAGQYCAGMILEGGVSGDYVRFRFHPFQVAA